MKIKGLLKYYVLLIIGFLGEIQAQITLVDPTNEGGFEVTTGWNTANDGSHDWYMNSSFQCSGTNGAFIGTTSASNDYNNTTAQVSHLYRDMTIPTGATNITLNFDYWCEGEDWFDGIKVYLIETSETPVAGTEISWVSQIGASWYNENPTCTSISLAINTANAGSTKRLVFSWINDTSWGSDPAGGLDNVQVTYDPATPANDLPCNATPLTVSSSCTYSTYTTSDATDSGEPDPGCSWYNGGDVWFSVIVPNSGQLNFDTEAAVITDIGMAIYSGSCNALTMIECDDDGGTGFMSYISRSDFTPGDSIWIRCFEYGNDNQGTFGICVSTDETSDTPCQSASISVGSSCSFNTYTLNGLTNSGYTDPSCAYYNGADDAWFNVIVPASGSLIIDSDNIDFFDSGMEIYSGTCGALSQLECDDDGSINGAMSFISYSGLSPGDSVFIRFWEYGGDNPGDFDLCVYSPECPTTLGSGVVNIGSLPYSDTGRSTCGQGDNVTSSNTTNTCGNSSYYSQEDEVFIFTPSSSGVCTIDLTGTSSNSSITLYQDCPYSGTCIAFSQSASTDESFCTNVTSGITYYLVVDGSSSCLASYNIDISAPASSSTGQICSSAQNIASLPYSVNSETTECMVDDYTSASIASCGTSYESGEDKVYVYTTTGAECLNIAITNAATDNIGFQIYDGCPDVGGTNCISNTGGATAGSLDLDITIPAAGTYYIIVDTWSTPFNTTYDLDITLSGSAPSNDLACNATPLNLGIYEPGDNSCSSNTDEPSTPSCWTTGSVNTVWFSFVCPASGAVNIITKLAGLTDSQMALYSGTCGASLIEEDCNDNMPNCGWSTSNQSEIQAIGLTPGNTYYIAVDGTNSETGSFNIIAVESTDNYPISAGQDCASPVQVCNETMTVGDPGYSGWGANCDWGSGGNCADGERSSIWYEINIIADGSLEFVIEPNDYNGTDCVGESDYDFILWKTTGTGSTDCATISSSLGDGEIACNFDGQGVTGTSSDGTATASGYNSCYDFSFESAVPVLNGETYLLAVQNFTGSTSGFSLDFSNTAAGVIDFTATQVTWGGSNNSNWADAANWGNCTIPACGIDVVIAASTSNQPVITTSATVNDITINAGSTLTMHPGATLTICGDFTNNGTISLDPTSEVIFNNASNNHLITGSFTGSNSLGKITITKTGGSVNLANGIEFSGDFVTSNGTSICNTAGYDVTLGGDFWNYDGDNTFTNQATSGTFTFNGSSTQTYDPSTSNSSDLTLNHVTLNNTGTGISLNHDLILGTSGILTLTDGIITTGANLVSITNTTAAAVTGENSGSFIYGTLRRYIATNTDTYNFPIGMGTTTTDYFKADILNNNLGGLSYLTASVSSLSESGNNIDSRLALASPYDTFDDIDNTAEWTITADAGITGNYGVNLYTANYSALPDNSFTVVKRDDSSTDYADWSTFESSGADEPGFAQPGRTLASGYAERTGFTSFSKYALATNVSPLPVELIYYHGKNIDQINLLEWNTASEINNDFFTLLRSTDGIHFEIISSQNGAGNSTEYNGYIYEDLTFQPVINFYKLLQTDFDGTVYDCGIVTIDNRKNGTISLQTFPNPVLDQLDIQITIGQEETQIIEIFDYTGKLVYFKNIDLTPGINKYLVDMSRHATGMYFISISPLNGENRISQKFIHR